MKEEDIKEYLKKNLRINSDIEDGWRNNPEAKRLVITLTLGNEILSETKLWI